MLDATKRQRASNLGRTRTDVWSSMAGELHDSDRHALLRLAVVVDEFWTNPTKELAADTRSAFGARPRATTGGTLADVMTADQLAHALIGRADAQGADADDIATLRFMVFIGDRTSAIVDALAYLDLNRPDPDLVDALRGYRSDLADQDRLPNFAPTGGR